MIKVFRKPYVKGLWEQYTTIKNCIANWSYLDKAPKQFNLGVARLKVSKDFDKFGDELFKVILQGKEYFFEESNLLKALKESVNKDAQTVVSNFAYYCE